MGAADFAACASGVVVSGRRGVRGVLPIREAAGLRAAKEGFAAGLKGDLYVILDTEITEELEQEGIAREVVSKVQHMRKTMDLDLMDKIRISMDADVEVSASVKKHEEYIKGETLALDILNVPIDQKEDINGHSTGISIDKA